MLVSQFVKGQTFRIHCLSIGSSGQVTVTWDRNGLSSSDFRSYYLYHSTASSGPFVAIDSVFIFSDTIQTHATANAANNAAWYTLVCKSASGGPDIYSDTVRAIQLTVLNPGSGFANLAWNVMHTPLISTHSKEYQIYREYPLGVFTRIDSVDASIAPNPMLYSDLISICNDSINYRIEVQDLSGCKSVSNKDGDIFRDLQPPAYPELDSVSVNATGAVVIGWPVNSSPDTRAYVVLQGVGSIWTPIDTLFGRNSTFSATGVNAAGSSISFELIAVDSCGNPSAQSQPHATIFLDGGLLLCSKSVSLSWNAYSYWNTAVSYDIWRSTSGGAEQLIGTTAATTYNDDAIVSGVDYCYRVAAHEIGSLRSSTSNRFCIVPVFPAPPGFCDIRRVSVLSNTNVEVVANVDPGAVVDGYELLRASSAAGPFNVVASQITSGVSTVTFTDQVPSTGAKVYYYQVVTVDSCGTRVKSSQVSRTILLKGTADAGGANLLNWTMYEHWPTGVSSYRVFRTVNGLMDPQPLVTVMNGNSLSVVDSVLDDFYSDGEFCYVVQAIEALGNPYFFIDTVFSNEVCVIQQPTMFIPNAFHPGGGINEIFRPYPQFVSSDDYTFRIYDRWGELIFSADDPQIGWDGSMDGKQAPEAVYVYQIESKQPDGSTFRRVGSVTLIR